jgi:hypothetical protein
LADEPLPAHSGPTHVCAWPDRAWSAQRGHTANCPASEPPGVRGILSSAHLDDLGALMMAELERRMASAIVRLALVSVRDFASGPIRSPRSTCSRACWRSGHHLRRRIRRRHGRADRRRDRDRVGRNPQLAPGACAVGEQRRLCDRHDGRRHRPLRHSGGHRTRPPDGARATGVGAESRDAMVDAWEEPGSRR